MAEQWETEIPWLHRRGCCDGSLVVCMREVMLLFLWGLHRPVSNIIWRIPAPAKYYHIDSHHHHLHSPFKHICNLIPFCSSFMSSTNRRSSRQQAKSTMPPTSTSNHTSSQPIDANTMPISSLFSTLAGRRKNQHFISHLDFVNVSDDKLRHLFYKEKQHTHKTIDTAKANTTS